jgi:hypothetical protein
MFYKADVQFEIDNISNMEDMSHIAASEATEASSLVDSFTTLKVSTENTNQVAKTFPLFNYLPFELRAEIWRRAMRDEQVPGVHYFTVCDKDDDTENVIYNEYGLSQQGPFLAAPSWGPKCFLAGSCGVPSTDSWQHQDDSTYLIDSGLWTACKESRDLMLKQVKHPNFPRSSSEYYDLTTAKLERTATARILRPKKTTATTMTGKTTNSQDDHEPSYITMYPDTDLFVLQKGETEYFLLNDINAAIPFASYDRGFSPLWNVAVEYISERDNKRTAWQLAEAIFGVEEQMTFYVIDYDASPARCQRGRRDNGTNNVDFRGDKFGYVVCSMCCASESCREWVEELVRAVGQIDYKLHSGDSSSSWLFFEVVVLACINL